MNFDLRKHIEEIVSEPIETSKLVFHILTSDRGEVAIILIEMGLNFKISSRLMWGYYSEVCIDFGFTDKELFKELSMLS